MEILGHEQDKRMTQENFTRKNTCFLFLQKNKLPFSIKLSFIFESLKTFTYI
jgi:hypothetical protein